MRKQLFLVLLIRSLAWQKKFDKQRIGSQRMICFSPEQEYFAKGTHGITGRWAIPELDDATPNDFITRLFEQARANIAKEREQYEPLCKQYEEAMENVRVIIDNVVDAETADAAARTIADKTGLSATTIRKRNKLSILTTDKIKAAEQRGATLMDLMAVANIEDDALRESVLEAAGTSNFANKLATAKEQEAAAKELEKARIQLESWAQLITRQEWNKDKRTAKWVRSITLGAKDADYSKPENAPEGAEYLCVYTAASKYVTVYIVTGEGTADEDALRREREAKLEELRKVACEEVRNRTAQLRDSFMENEFRGTKEQTNAVLEFAKAAFHLGSNDSSTKDKLAAAEKMLSLRTTSNPALALAVTVYCFLEKGYSPLSYTTWNNKHQANEKLDTVYRFLMAVGYQMSDEEKAWQDGTHPCFSDPEIEEGSE